MDRSITITKTMDRQWDIVGKALDKPVYELMGGLVHERLRSYTYLNAPKEAASNQQFA